MSDILDHYVEHSLRPSLQPNRIGYQLSLRKYTSMNDIQVKPLPPQKREKVNWEQVWKPLLEKARWAPSGDNGQPWRVIPGTCDFSAQVVLDNSQKLAFLDFQGEASRIAIGGFLENLTVLATCHGYAFHIGDTASSKPDNFSTNIWLEPLDNITIDPLSNFVGHRHSNRKPQLTKPLPTAIIQTLEAASENGIRAKFISDRKKIDILADATAMADRVRFTHLNCHEEFHEKVRWTKQEAVENPAGFSVETFEINSIEKLALRATKKFQVLRLADRWFRMGNVAANAARRQVVNSSTIGALIGNPTAKFSWVNVGRSLQRIWLQATAHDLGFQVLAVAPFLSRRFQLEGERGFEPWQSKCLGDVNSLLNQVFGDHEIAIMFRVGPAKPASARTGRHSWKQLVQKNET